MRKQGLIKYVLIIAFLIVIIVVLFIRIIKIAKNSDEYSERDAGQQENIEEGGYYWENSQEVIEVIDVDNSNDIPSESEVITLLEDRGFTDCQVTSQYDLNGEYYEETEILKDTSIKHPMYTAYYMNSAKEVWTIYVVNGKVMAFPATYNLDSGLQSEVVYSESKEITSYDYNTNKFYVRIPKKTETIVVVVDRIDADTLEKMTVEEINNYAKEY